MSDWWDEQHAHVNFILHLMDSLFIQSHFFLAFEFLDLANLNTAWRRFWADKKRFSCQYIFTLWRFPYGMKWPTSIRHSKNASYKTSVCFLCWWHWDLKIRWICFRVAARALPMVCSHESWNTTAWVFIMQRRGTNWIRRMFVQFKPFQWWFWRCRLFRNWLNFLHSSCFSKFDNFSSRG